MKPGSRNSAIALAALILAAAGAAAVWVLSDRYETLFASLEPQDAAAVIAELERTGVPYELGDGGMRISVPSDQVHETRVKLMGSGVSLRGGVGFEIFDDSDFGMTEFAQRINYQRALEGELSRTIASLKEVKYARVHLVMPESSLFRKQQNPPSASVTLFLKHEANLEPSRVIGIQRLVSAAVPGLDVNSVTVTDHNGFTVTREAEQDEESRVTAARLQKKQEIEAYLKNKLTDVLERALGPERGLVSVDVSLNMNQVRTTREKIIPQENGEGGILRRRESRTESGKASALGEGIVTETEYRLGREVEQIVITPGAIERLSVGVLVSDEIPAQRLEEIRALVAMAAGLNSARGDALAIFAAPLPGKPGSGSEIEPVGRTPPLVGVPQHEVPDLGQSAADKEPVGWLPPQMAFGLLAGIVVLLALLVMALRPGKTRRLRPEERTLMLQRLETWLQEEPAPVVEEGRF